MNRSTLKKVGVDLHEAKPRSAVDHRSLELV